jgi:hypothetical protein
VLSMDVCGQRNEDENCVLWSRGVEKVIK